MGNSVSVAIVGVGGIVMWQHLKHLTAMPNVKIAGYLKNKSGRAEKAAQQYGGRLYDSIDQIADDGSVDAVIVSVPPFAHGEIELKLIDAGKALLIEKPIGIDLATVEKIAAAVKAKNVLTAVGYHWRYHTTIDTIRQTLQSRPPIGGCGFWFGDRPGVWWWRDKKTSGGQHVEQSTHVFDLANYLITSQPVSAVATGRQLGVYTDAAHSVEDVSTAQITYANGVTLTVWTSDVIEGKASKTSLELFSVGGRYELSFDGLVSRDQQGVTELANAGNPYQRLNEAFINAVITGDRTAIRSNYAAALITHRVTMAVDRSITSGKIETISID